MVTCRLCNEGVPHDAHIVELKRRDPIEAMTDMSLKLVLMTKERDEALRQIENLKGDLDQWRSAAYQERKEQEQKRRGGGHLANMYQETLLQIVDCCDGQPLRLACEALGISATQVGDAIINRQKISSKFVEKTKDKTRYCVKCGIPVEDTAHVYSCKGPGTCANPAPFIEKQ